MRTRQIGIIAGLAAMTAAALPAQAETYFYDSDSQREYEVVPGAGEHASFFGGSRYQPRQMREDERQRRLEMAAVPQPGAQMPLAGTLSRDARGNYIFAPNR